jgi:molybdopterin-guanine dinucleotide biosynthesis protein A
MGTAKALLPFGPERMLTRVVRLLQTVVSPIVVVGAQGQSLPAVPPDIIIARDEHVARGPLEGIAAGLAAISPHSTAAYITSCDVPLLVPAFVQRMIELLGDDEIAVPCDGDFHHPLAAVYRVSVADRVRHLLAADRLRTLFLFELARTRRVDVGELRNVDPALATLRNLNHPDDYLAALAIAGFQFDREFKSLGRGG